MAHEADHPVPLSEKPTIGITLGDPAGIGPEIVLKSLTDPQLLRKARFVVYGMNELLNYAADSLEIDPYWYRVQHDSPRTRRRTSEDVLVLDFDEFDGITHLQHQPSKAGGLASKIFVEEAIIDAMRPPDHPRHIDAIVTAPISKKSWQMAGFRWPGHTELLAHRTRSRRCVMMFASAKLNVALATTHIPLMAVRDVLNIGRVFDPIDLGNAACKLLGIDHPRIAVAGLNPHAGEGGQFGHEEQSVITPAIKMARNSGIDAEGPFPADTIFNHAVNGKYDLVVAMYHDQGLIPVKLLCWEQAVNWTLGLPIIRTSPDHGTAFDIAGTGSANPASFTAAVQLATKLARNQIANATRGRADTGNRAAGA